MQLMQRERQLSRILCLHRANHPQDEQDGRNLDLALGSCLPNKIPQFQDNTSPLQE